MRAVRFTDRAEAGRRLGAALRDPPAGPLPGGTLMLGLPRGGAVVAAVAAEVCDLAWDVWLVRKLGHPLRPELALGALAEDGEPVWDPGAPDVGPEVRERVAAAEAVELVRRRALYRGGAPSPDVRGRTVVLVDDGIATGSTARAAARSVRAAGAARVVVAAPVGSPEAVRMLAGEADEVVVLSTPRGFRAVGSWYDDFSQTTDAEVVRLLAGRGR